MLDLWSREVEVEILDAGVDDGGRSEVGGAGEGAGRYGAGHAAKLNGDGEGQGHGQTQQGFGKVTKTSVFWRG